MSIEQVVAEKMRTLPTEKQKEVLDFVDFLYQKRIVKGTRRSVKGLWADLGVEITEDDIAEVRGDMWANFPRGISNGIIYCRNSSLHEYPSCHS